MVFPDAGVCVAAEHLLDLYPAVGLLLAAGTDSMEAGTCHIGLRVGHYFCDFCLYAVRADSVRDPDLYRRRHVGAGSPGQVFPKRAAAGGTSAQRRSLLFDEECERRAAGV